MIPIETITLGAEGVWTFTWSDTGADYYRIVFNGQLLATTTELSYDAQIPFYDDYPPPLEITNDDEIVLSEQFSPFLVMQWYVEDCQAYTIEEYDGDDWQQLEFVAEDLSQWLHTYQSMLLVDETNYQFRVVALDLWEQESTPQQFNIYMVTPPVLDVATIVIGYDAGTTSITVEEAA